MTKEFVIWEQSSEAAALDAVRSAASDYIRRKCEKGAVLWTWKTLPEALHGDDGWRAYGRITWGKA